MKTLVLILVLMEDTLRVMFAEMQKLKLSVLILVLMEDTLRVGLLQFLLVLCCLNPCFNGRYSQSAKSVKNLKVKNGLNPCFNGRYSQRDSLNESLINGGLNPCFNGRYSQRLYMFLNQEIFNVKS